MATIKTTLSSIQTTLGCDANKSLKIAKELIDLANDFDLDITLDELWNQEKPYYQQYGCNSFDAGLTKRTITK